MKHRNVTIVLLVVALAGVAYFLAPFVATFTGSTPEVTQPTVKVSDIKTGSFVELALPSSRVFVLRGFDEEVHVFSVPFSDTAYWLPEFDWSHPAVPCAEFAPDNRDGMLIEDGKFRCRKPDQGEFFRREHAWSYDGKNLGYRTSDLKIPAYELIDDEMVLSNWK